MRFFSIFAFFTVFSCATFAAPTSPIIWKSSCASKAYNLGSATCLVSGGASGVGTATKIPYYDASGNLASSALSYAVATGFVAFGGATTSNRFDVLGAGITHISGNLVLDGASGSGSVQALQYRMGAANGDFTWSQGQVGTSDKITVAHTGFAGMGVVMTSENILALPAQAAGVAPTNPVTGGLALTSGFKLCVWNGSAWKNASDGSTGCTF